MFLTPARASRGIQDVNENVNHSSTMAGTICDDIAQVNASVQEISDSSGQVSQNSEELSALSQKRRERVGRFKI